MKFTKSIGIIGGLGPHAGAHALKTLFNIAHEDMDCYEDWEYPEVILHSVPFPGTGNEGIVRLDAVLNNLLNSLRKLERAGVEVALIACNSSHIFFQALQKNTAIELVSLIDSAAEQLCARSSETFTLLASETVVKSDIPRQIAEKTSQEWLPLTSAQQATVDDLIASAMDGCLTGNVLNNWRRLLDTLMDQRRTTVVIACTELSWLSSMPSELNTRIRCIDTLDAAIRNTLLFAALPSRFR